MNILKHLLLFCLLLLFSRASGQMPECGTLYYEDGSYFPGDPLYNGHQLWSYNPTCPVSATNPNLNTIQLPYFGKELAVSENLDASSPSPTFYTTINNYYYYRNDTGWVNTGHLAKDAQTSSQFGLQGIGAGGGYIYSSYDSLGYWNWQYYNRLKVFRYDGTGNAVQILDILNISPPFAFLSIFLSSFSPSDVAADCHGNFYLLRGTQVSKYDAAGSPLQTWNATGSWTIATLNVSLAFIGDTLFTNTGKGTVNPSLPSINFIPAGAFIAGGMPFDMAACPGGGSIGAMETNIDTDFYCGYGVGSSLAAVGAPLPLSTAWSVLNGSAVMTGSGSAVSVTAVGISQLVLSAVCYDPDTVTIINPQPKVNSGTDDYVTGCKGIYLDTLEGSIADTISGILYSYSWSPVSQVSSGLNTLTPVVAPLANTDFVLNVFTLPNQGGCLWKDTVSIIVIDSSVGPDFTYQINYSCTSGDTIHFQNGSSNALIYSWDFGDDSVGTVIDPIHIYYDKGSYQVRLIAANSVCIDTLVKPVNNLDPQVQPFDLGEDITICSGTSIDIVLDAKPPIGAMAIWNDGTASPTFNVSSPGLYWVTVSKSLCSFSDTIQVVDQLCDCLVDIPSGFTPNGDGRNDLFRALTQKGCLVRGYLLQVYNRWGQLVYTGNKYGEGWDGYVSGQPADIGTYMYTLQLETGTDSKMHYYKGDMLLIR